MPKTKTETTKTSTRTTGKRKAAAKKAASKQFLAVILFAVGILLLALSCISGDNVWLWCHNFVLGLFSWAAFLVGPIVIVCAVVISREKAEEKIGYAKIIEAVVLILLLCAASQIFARTQPDGGLVAVIKALYENGQVLSGGGFMSLLIGVPLLKLFGFWGAAITVVLLIFTFVMILTGSTIAGLISSAAKPVQKLEEVYEEHKERREQRVLRDQDKKPRFDIDVPMDTAPFVASPPLSSKEDDISKAKERLLGTAGTPLAPQAPATLPEKEEIFPQTGSAPNYIDEIITRAVSGETLLDENGYPCQIPPRFDFAVKDEADTASLAIDQGENLFGNTLVNDQGEEFIVPPVDAIPLPTDADDHSNVGYIAPTPAVFMAEEAPRPVYTFPPINLLEESRLSSAGDVSDELKANAERLVDTLKSFGVQTRVIDISRGPAVTRYELQPSAGVKISKITGLADDIALNLASAGVRIEAPIPNKAAVGIEVPNKVINIVTIREVIDSPAFEAAQSRLSVALGKDITGNIAVADLSKMPHMLIAGSTGSGKSVCINSIIISLLYKSSPDEVKLLMIDPKMVELGGYNGIPHLLVPVVTDPKKAAGALCWAVGEMMNRYKTFGENGVRDITGYNKLSDKDERLQNMPHIVIIIDELADLMMVAPNEVEDYVCRLAQMARAAGMHLVIATQRPSVDVITGIIKANIPSRIAFAVSSQVDSRTILDMGGAEKLLGRGDMLFNPIGSAKPTRVQGCFVTDKEVERVVAFVKEGEKQDYDAVIMEEIERQAVVKKQGGGGGGNSSGDGDDEYTLQAIECVVDAGQASTSLLQRKLKLGYARAARIMDEMEAKGIVGPFEGSKPRQVLISKERFYEMKLSDNYTQQTTLE